jgi:hypothetical protein
MQKHSIEDFTFASRVRPVAAALPGLAVTGQRSGSPEWICRDVAGVRLTQPTQFHFYV